MKKYLIAPLLLATSASVLADTGKMSAPSIYGRINLAFQHVDETDLKPAGLNGKTELRSNSSRLGVKGEQLLDDRVTLVYQLEFRIAPDELGDDKHMKHRNSFIGFKGAFGELKMGIHDTPLKLIQERIDVFNALDGDLKEVISKHGENRTENTVIYTSPRMQGVGVSVAHISAEEPGQRNGLSSALSYQSKVFYAAVAYDDQVKEDVSTLRAVVRTTMDAWQLGAMYEESRQQDTFANGARSADGWLVSVAYRTTPKTQLNAQYGQSDLVYRNGETVSVGIDYQYVNNTRLYAFSTRNAGEQAGTKQTAGYNGVGIEYRF
ncbi:MAG: porin [Bacterioplanes sp.]|nr:porin [Bacterioplanes sp.]